MYVNKGFYISKQRAESVVYETKCCSCKSVGTTLLLKMASKMAAIHFHSSKIVIQNVRLNLINMSELILKKTILIL